MVKNRELRDFVREKRVYQQRMILSLMLFFCLAAILATRYIDLQIFQHARFVTESDRNRIHTLPVAPRRGLIYDRNGVLLAENQPSYNLTLTIERVDNLEELLKDLQQLFDIDNKNIEKFRERIKRRTRYQAVPLKFKLNDDEISRFAVNRYRLNGVEVQAQLVRHYPQGREFSHIVGYVGRINTRDQEKLFVEEKNRINYAATDHVGKIGLEKYYESALHGQVGSQYVETNAHGRVLRVLQQIDPKPGADLKLTVDARLQKEIHKLLDGRRGSVVVLDVKSGGVLSMVSTPSYDPNLFVTGISSEAFGKLRDSVDLPMFNRALQGQYPPGSTIKPIIGLAGLYYKVVRPDSTVADPGWYQLPNDDRYYRDWKKGGHGDLINLSQAIVESCDVYFYDLAYKLGVDRIHEFSSQFGLGKKTAVDSSSERSGLLPSRAWKRENKRKPWFPGETLNIGIGQGYMLVTPMQLAAATATIASRGDSIRPRFVMGGLNEMPESQQANKSSQLSVALDIANKQQVLEKDWQYIHNSMEAVVHSPKGTASAIGVDSMYRMAGKTGTAQVIGIAQDAEYDKEAIAERQRDHALFVGFAPLKNPKVAVAVIVENGGSGSTAAAPIARKVFDWVINNEDSKIKPAKESLPLYAMDSKPFYNEGSFFANKDS